MKEHLLKRVAELFELTKASQVAHQELQRSSASNLEQSAAKHNILIGQFEEAKQLLKTAEESECLATMDVLEPGL